MKTILRNEVGDRANTLTFRRGAGCSHCNGTGYQGRIGIFEFLEMDENLIQALHSGNPLHFGEAARKQPGYQNLRRSAIGMAAQGHTTMAQVIRATYGLDD